jgi:hypothetical protein
MLLAITYKDMNSRLVDKINLLTDKNYQYFDIHL